MLIKINGQPQISFEQFEETFREVFGREMTAEERRWLSSANFADDPVETQDSEREDAA